MTAPTTLSDADPVVLARGLGAGRIAIGIVLLAVPSLWSRVVTATPVRPEVISLARIAGARDLGLGLGTVLAARHGATPELRRWVQASALGDGVDSVVFLRASTFPRSARLASLAAAISATALGAAVASRLPRD